MEAIASSTFISCLTISDGTARTPARGTIFLKIPLTDLPIEPKTLENPFRKTDPIPLKPCDGLDKLVAEFQKGAIEGTLRFQSKRSKEKKYKKIKKKFIHLKRI